MASRWSGNILPFATKDWVPRSSALVCVLLVACSLITSTTFGYDGSMINGLNILASYNTYFDLNTVTNALNTASVWIGGIIAGVSFGKVTDLIGRRPSLFYAAVITLVAVVLQTAAQDIGMFVFARILIGFGTTASALTGPAYLAESLPVTWRSWGLGIFNDAYYVGGLIAAGVTYGTSFMTSTWAWRAPSAVQGAFSVMCIIILPFIPESPRWLAYQGRTEDALRVIALTHANGDVNDTVVQTQYKEIIDAIEYEKSLPEPLSVKQMFKTPPARKRIVLCTSVAVFSTVAGNVIVSYYLGQMLNNAGITNQTTQLQINIILNAFCLLCSLAGTYYVERLGRKPTAIMSITSLTVFLFLVGGLTKKYGNSTNDAGIYATVACIFLFMGSYSFGWTPLLYVYPPEVLNYAIRANGMGVVQLALNGTALMAVFAFPIALNAIGWKMYIINAAWNILEIPFVAWYWVETKGKTLEEIDELLEGRREDVNGPDVEKVVVGGNEQARVSEDEK
ncbi:Hexose transporter protein [Mycena chlorophos]|uniref:Hexose transporter protein n=1 Tax=Mycena chlorophos TaxID=658473 RepID=A0A8H6SIN9_MYCCL|nr:Hexose transporter protein [Mycena chlorophos]